MSVESTSSRNEDRSTVGPRGRRWSLRQLLVFVAFASVLAYATTRWGIETADVEIIDASCWTTETVNDGGHDGAGWEVGKISFRILEADPDAARVTHWFLDPPLQAQRPISAGSTISVQYRVHPWLGRPAEDPQQVLAEHWGVAPGQILESIEEVLPEASR